jgi:hypothetical protein
MADGKFEARKKFFNFSLAKSNNTEAALTVYDLFIYEGTHCISN